MLSVVALIAGSAIMAPKLLLPKWQCQAALEMMGKDEMRLPFARVSSKAVDQFAFRVERSR